ncbi:MAG: sigma-54 dependent transcriptional regulator [Planctomycetaceae bacterium]
MQLLIAEDDLSFREMCAQWFEKHGHSVLQAETGQAALELLGGQQCDVVILDMNLPGLSGIEFLERLRETDVETEVVILTGEGSIESAVQAMKLGACDYLTKPFPLPELEQRCQLAFQRGQIRKENRQLRALLERKKTHEQMIGESVAMQEVFHLIERIAPTDKPVLIQGESGTGKELVARALYRKSLRAEKPFVTVNCAALPEHLVENEFFGHEKGAFTGASTSSPGLFEVADGGTMFIDEIGELPLALQPKLLRVLEDGSLRRVGSAKERRVNVRVITATNRDLRNDVAEKRFREDLYYRIDVLRVELPPLRERNGDIPLLMNHFLGDGWAFDEEAQQAILAYSWPGNVRQLRNSLERAMVLAENRTITLDDLPREVTEEFLSQQVPSRRRDSTHSQNELAEIERAHILKILSQHGGNKSQAARALGIHRRKLYRLMERLQIQENVN